MAEDLKVKIKDFYRLAQTSPGEAATKYLSEDFQWVNPLPESIPFGGTYIGKEGFFEYLTKLDAAITMSPLHFSEVIAEGNLVSAIGVEKDTMVKHTGKTYTMPFVHVLRFNNEGKIYHVREYNDITDMIRAFTPG